ncbi:MAG: RNA polymerase factor sigma-54 [Sphaerochaetaceae bacterium]|nr:RNA polymerase factor sigma-54 [Candidatus Cloacimonadota bacterium]
MNPTLGLQQTLKQQLTLSPQLIQTFEILAMSSLELQQKIKTEIEQNPALEIPQEKAISIERMAAYQERHARDDDYSDSSAYNPENYRKSVRFSGHWDQEASDRNQQMIEGVLSERETLQEYLLRQLGCLHIDEVQLELGKLLISNLDSNGFHRNPVETLVKENKRTRLLETLAIIQSLDPPGIGVTDFRESLILQAKHDNLEEDDLKLFEIMVNEHLQLLRLNKFREVGQLLEIEEEKVELLYGYLKTLNPFPGKLYDTSEILYIIPDIYVRKIEGKLQLRLNTDVIPTLSIDPDFKNLKDETRAKDKQEISSYIANAVRNANQLISQVNMRSETIKKIALQLLKFQSEFFLDGPRYLKPLTYRQIAQELSLHETTISRAVNGKYIDTDWGIIPIKELFSSALQTTIAGEEEVSKRAVMDMVQEIITTHKGSRALSDQKIADMLGEKGIKIARRTVNKYRNELNIDSSYERIP